MESNTISVEVTSCDRQTANHVMWHYANWRLWAKKEDLMAWRGLAGFLSKEDLIQEKQKLGASAGGRANVESGHIKSLGEKYGALAMSPDGWLYKNRVEYGKLGGKTVVDTGVGIHSLSKEQRSDLAKRFYLEGKGLASISPEQRSEISAKAGLISGQLHKEKRTGVCGIPPEEHSRRVSATNKQRWVCPVCGYLNIARHVNKHMAQEHDLPKTAKVKR